MKMDPVTHYDVFSHMEKWAPNYLAYNWDPVGLQVGSHKDLTTNVLISLDITEEVVNEAIEKQVNLIIAHHPLLFKPLKSLNITSQKGKIIQKLIKYDISVYAAHTNLDNADGGVNDMLADRLQLQQTTPLIKEYTEELLKLVVYVPADHVNKVKNALGNAGAGFIGNYSHCTFQSAGTGTFKPLEGTDPFIGKKNELTHVKEERLETIIEQKNEIEIIKQLFEAHPYEEVAYDLYPVRQEGKSYGLGRIGYLEEKTSLQSLCEMIKHAFQVNHLRFVGNPSQTVQKIAIIGGSGEKYIHAALQNNADVFITGDVSFHPAQDAQEAGLCLIDPGHYIEKIMKSKTKAYLLKKWPNINIYTSDTVTDPFHFI